MNKTGVGLAFLVAALRADGQNLLPDPAFSSGVGALTPNGAIPSTITWINLAGPDGARGFARLQFLGPGAGFAAACLPVIGGRTYSYGATFSPIGASAQIVLEFYPNGSCQGLLLVGQTLGPPVFAGSGWQFDPGPDLTAPASAGSVQFRLGGVTGASTSVTVDIDNIYFGLQGTGPPGIQDVPALSGSQLLVLALALAIGGLFLIRSD